MRRVVILALGILMAAGAVVFFGADQTTKPNDNTSAIVEIEIPAQLSGHAIIGKRLYQENCLACHGENAVGQEKVAPPLVHKIYEPSHHGDESFERAIAVGVRAHHWNFGNMPKIEGLTRADVAAIISYIRELQRYNGIS